RKSLYVAGSVSEWLWSGVEAAFTIRSVAIRASASSTTDSDMASADARGGIQPALRPKASSTPLMPIASDDEKRSPSSVDDDTLPSSPRAACASAMVELVG